MNGAGTEPDDMKLRRQRVRMTGKAKIWRTKSGEDRAARGCIGVTVRRKCESL